VASVTAAAEAAEAAAFKINARRQVSLFTLFFSVKKKKLKKYKKITKILYQEKEKNRKKIMPVGSIFI